MLLHAAPQAASADNLTLIRRFAAAIFLFICFLFVRSGNGTFLFVCGLCEAERYRTHIAARECVMLKLRHALGAGFALVAGLLFAAPAAAQSLAYSPASPSYPYAPSYAPAADETDDGAAAELPQQLRRQLVAYPTAEPAGTIVIDPAHTFLYLTLGDGKALRYGIGAGRAGFTWSGVEKVARKAEWPDWYPPSEMVARQPYLPRFMAGGPGNPLGARAMYLGNTDYRIHGTNDPNSIGKHVSSGCIRMLNADVIDLYNRVEIGAKVVVLPDGAGRLSAAGAGVVIDAPRDGRMSATIAPESQMARGSGPSGIY
jgi:lipoprotein-anchoring transpeptidase ErfK/SrfK